MSKHQELLPAFQHVGNVLPADTHTHRQTADHQQPEALEKSTTGDGMTHEDSHDGSSLGLSCVVEEDKESLLLLHLLEDSGEKVR